MFKSEEPLFLVRHSLGCTKKNFHAKLAIRPDLDIFQGGISSAVV